MNLFRTAPTLALGGCIGLLIVAILPNTAQRQVASWQSMVGEVVSGPHTPSETEARAGQPRETSQSTKEVTQPPGSSRPTNQASQPHGNSQPISEVSQLPVKVATLELLIHQTVNQHRQNTGLQPLAYDATLSGIARGHSQDMARRTYFEHETPEGYDPSDRAARAGYTCRKDYGSYYTYGVAENIYLSHLVELTVYVSGLPIKRYKTDEQHALSIVAGWMNSPGHRNNILDRAYDRVGTGVAIAPDEKVLVTQNFC